MSADQLPETRARKILRMKVVRGKILLYLGFATAFIGLSALVSPFPFELVVDALAGWIPGSPIQEALDVWIATASTTPEQEELARTLLSAEATARMLARSAFAAATAAGLVTFLYGGYVWCIARKNLEQLTTTDGRNTPHGE
jgi:hypothetical protein